MLVWVGDDQLPLNAFSLLSMMMTTALPITTMTRRCDRACENGRGMRAGSCIEA